MKKHKTLGIIQPRIFHYRVAFYEALRHQLAENGIDLILIHGKAGKHEKAKRDEGQLQWGVPVRNWSLRFGNTELLWQPCFEHLKNCDLVIVQQESRMLINYWLLLTKRFRKQKIGFWGHGMNCQSSNPSGLKERWKRLFLKSPDWWFAYTDFTKDILLRAGYPEDKITDVQNANDTVRLSRYRDEITDTDKKSFRKEVGLRGNKIGIYCGSFYEHKRIPFLLDAAKKIKTDIEDFELIVIGAGSDQKLVANAASEHPWIHPIGARFGRDMAVALSVSNVFLLPGGVGLSILDSLVFGLPLFTTDCRLHGPEITYLENGRNGFMTANHLDQYVDMIVEVLKNPQVQREMSEKCLIDSRKYSVENMAHNFTQGVLKALSSP